MSDSVTHIAAPYLRIGDRRLRQRCSWCGAVLLDYDLTRVAVANKPDGSPGDPPAMFETGALVRVILGTGGNKLNHVVEPEIVDGDPRLPEDSCANLDDEVTV